MGVTYDQQDYMEVKHGVGKKWDEKFMKDLESLRRAMCQVQLKHRKRAKDFMLISGLKETIGQLTFASSVHWYGHELRREDGHVLRRSLDFKVVGQGKIGRPKRTWMKHGLMKKVSLSWDNSLC